MSADPSHVWVKTELLDSTNGDAASTIRTARSHRSRDEDYDDCMGPVDWGWAYGVVLSTDSQAEVMEIGIRDEESTWHGRNVTLPTNAWELEQVVMANKFGDHDNYEEDPVQYPDDMIVLTHLHEPAVVHCLRERYLMDKIYTNTGSILLALNPFKHCKSLYSRKVMQQYWKRGEASTMGATGDLQVLPPHVYATADESFRTMTRRLARQTEDRRASSRKSSCDQSILVSGESGAGKTVTTKFIMQYLAALSQRTHSSSPSTLDSTDASADTSADYNIEQQVLQSNPILESFGNARTIRNDNSSRFGKFIEIQFAQTGTLVGASIETYLLEKVRLISQSEGERNFHIFYEVFCMTDGDRESYGLDGYQFDDFRMINQSGTYDRRDGVDDYDTYDELRRAMETMGMSQDEQRDVLVIPCATLHGSNLTFVAKSADESALDADNEHLQPFLKLMGLSAGALNKALCYLNIKAGKEVHTRTLPKVKAEKGLEAIIKATYSALFTFLVKRINESITVKNDGGRSRRGSSAKAGQAKIAVLDIFGFESFKTNSFEQLCINYCNEALQQQFTRFVLQKEQEEYEREGIEWKFISFPENQDVLDLIDKKGSGILNILDDQCRAPGTTDKTFCIDLYRKCSEHSHFEADYRQVGAQKFGIKHYAGPVEYDTEGFVEKNRDELPKEATDLLLSSEKEIVKKLSAILQNPSPTTAPSPRGMSPGLKRGGLSSTRVTVGGQFSRQLQELRNRIDTTTPHYIRCLKPNDLLVPDHFNPLIIANQLRYAGVIEAVRVSRVGYPQRYSHTAFMNRYKMICLVELKQAARSLRKEKPIVVLVRALVIRLQHLNTLEIENRQCDEETTCEEDDPMTLSSIGIEVGKTKVFLRQGAYDTIEKLRGSKLVDSVVTIQAAARHYVARREYVAMLELVVMIQCFLRVRLACYQVTVLRRNFRATLIQSAWRRSTVEARFESVCFFARWLQRVVRGRAGRRRYRELDTERKVVVVQTNWRMHRFHFVFLSQRAASKTVQRAVRCWRSRIELKKLRLGARDLQAAVSQRDGLRNENDELRRRLEDALDKATSQESMTKAIAERESELGQFQLRIDELVSTIDAIQNELAEAKAREAEAHKLTTQSRIDTETARIELADTTAALEKTQRSLSESHEEASALSIKVSRQAKEIEMLALALTNHEAEPNDVTLESERDVLSKDLEATRRDLNDAQEQSTQRQAEAERVASENRKLRLELESVMHTKEDTIQEMSTKLEQASLTIFKLEQKHREIEVTLSERDQELQLTRSDMLDAVRESRLSQDKLTQEVQALNIELNNTRGTNTRLENEKERNLEQMDNQIAELSQAAELAKVATTKQIHKLTFELEEAKRREAEHTPEHHKEAPNKREMTQSPAAEEILTLQDEVDRELDEHIVNGRQDDTDESHEGLAHRYEELRRLADAGIEKDREIERLRQQLEQLIEDQSQASDSPEAEEVEELQDELTDLRQPYDSQQCYKTKRKGFFGRMFDGDDACDEPKLRKEVASLKSVNELLRSEVEQSGKSIRKLEEELQEERDRAKKELESFGNSLRAVDELRQAAESMSRQLHRKQMESPAVFVSETPDGSGTLEDATKIIERAKENFRKFNKDEKVKSKTRKKRRGSENGSIVSSFF